MKQIVCYLSRFFFLASRGMRHHAAIPRPALLFVLLLLLLADCAWAIGCGEPVADAQRCTDWQCSRKVQSATDDINNSSSFFCVRGNSEGGECIINDDCYKELKCSLATGTCVQAESGKVVWQGYVAVGIAGLFFGSNFIPAKKVRTGNGIMFQFFMCTGIFCVGVITEIVRGNYQFYALSMVGGAMWALGNTMCVPVIRCIGMGLGVTLWGATNMVMGWASGRFGFFGVKKESVSIEWMSYLAPAVALVAIGMFGAIEPSNEDTDDTEGTPDEATNLYSLDPPAFTRSAKGALPSFSRPLGVAMALVAGLLFGINFDPSQYMMDHYSSKTLEEDVKYSPNGLDYVFSAFCGIFLLSATVTLIFMAVQKWTPTLFEDDGVDYEKMAIPAFVCGVMWGIANVAWFVANTNLGLIVSFPTICIGPSVVASLWGVFLFGEIKGRRNLSLLGGAFCVVGISVMLTVLSS